MKSTEPFQVVDNTFDKIDLVDENNQFHRDMHASEALKMADDMGLDLVCFAEGGKDQLALCKLIDFGKWKYQCDKKKKLQKKKQKNEIKEIRFSPVISEHDIAHKVKHAKEFIDQGHKLHFTMRLRRRQSRSVATERMAIILEKCEEFATVTGRKDENGYILVKLSKKKTKE